MFVPSLHIAHFIRELRPNGYLITINGSRRRASPDASLHFSHSLVCSSPATVVVRLGLTCSHIAWHMRSSKSYTPWSCWWHFITFPPPSCFKVRPPARRWYYRSGVLVDLPRGPLQVPVGRDIVVLKYSWNIRQRSVSSSRPLIAWSLGVAALLDSFLMM